MKSHASKQPSRSKAESSGSGGQWSRQLRAAPRQHAQALQLQALQRAGEEEELQMKRSPLQRAALEEESEPMQGKALQREGEEDEMQLKREPLQRAEEEEEPMQGKADSGGLSAPLRSGIESLSGQDLSDVQVHRNSNQPAAVNALAYAQGNDIHLGPGQEQHLPHEAWHVVQQRQGRVQPTLQLEGGVAVNDDAALEAEADQMGARALNEGSAKL
jgi:Domain of unknown function (DUF4157)